MSGVTRCSCPGSSPDCGADPDVDREGCIELVREWGPFDEGWKVGVCTSPPQYVVTCGPATEGPA